MKRNLDKSKGVSAIFKKYIDGNKGKYVAFCRNINHLKLMKSCLEQWFSEADLPCNFYEVHCKNQEKDKQFNAFMNDTGLSVCLSVAMLSEGVHGIDGVILLRDTISPNLYYQQIGRVFAVDMRSVPIIFDLVSNCETIMNCSLKNDLLDAIEKRDKEGKKKDSKDGNVKETEDVSETKKITKDDIEKFFLFDHVVDSVRAFRDIENRLNNSWDLYIRALTEFKEKNGSCHVPTEYIHIFENGIRLNLGKWARDVRNNTRKGKTRYSLTLERINQLNNLGFVWNQRNRRTDIDITLNNRERQFKNKMNLARQALNEGVIITSTNNKYNGVDLYYWHLANKNKFTKDEKEILKQLIKNVYKKMVLIIDIKNCKTNTYSSIAEAGRALCNDFHLVNTERSGMSTVSRYLSVNSENSIYKGQFHFKYANSFD